MKRRKAFFSILLLSLFTSTLSLSAAQFKYTGCRQSSYGANPFPTANEWGYIHLNLQSFFPGSSPVGVWIVGNIVGDNCNLQFPSPGGYYDYINFDDYDYHDEYLSHFDSIGVKVFLQVESGAADIEDLITIIMDRYKHHPSVFGFGVDIEWFAEDYGTGKKVTDSEAEAWETKLKTYNNDYKLFLKHWDTNWMPPNYRGEIFFINDGQNFSNLDECKQWFGKWANAFPDNPVIYQGGYPADRNWWQNYSNPPQQIGNALAEECGADQEFGFCWVDFSLRYSEVEDMLFQKIDPVPTINNVAINKTTKVDFCSFKNALKISLPENHSYKSYSLTSLNGQTIKKGNLSSLQNITIDNISRGVWILNLSGIQSSKSIKTLIK